MKKLIKMSAFILMVSLMTSMTVNAKEKILIGLITKTESNPFFVKMREGAKSVAKELGVELQSFSGKFLARLNLLHLLCRRRNQN